MNKRRPGTTIDTTLAYCPECQGAEQSLITADSTGVFLERICPRKGSVSTRIAADRRWYMERAAEPQAIRKPPIASKTARGCPFDCGPCRWHASSLRLPVVSITNLCNLDCPICFTYNRPDLAYNKSKEEMEAILSHLRDSVGEMELINITGGEPTLHPHIFDLLELCRENPIGRITMNSNGLRISADEEFALRIRDSGIQVVLSLDTFDPEKSVIIHGRDVTAEKRKALETLERLGIPTTILTVCIRGVNEEDTAEIVRNYLPKGFVRGITIQNMTFTGKNGSRFEPRDHVTIDEVEELLATHAGLDRNDFFPLGSYHPLCYSVAYYISDGRRLLSLTRLVDWRLLTEATVDSYLLEGNETLAAAFREGVDRLWAEGEDKETVTLLRRFITELFPAGQPLSRTEQRSKAEGLIKMVYIHPHMDEDNFDLGRVSRCGDLVPDESGRMIPACSYNLLYRQRDSRFWKGDVP